jgi:hypothetical protein
MARLSETQIEAAAREYCRIVGADPDGLVPHGPAPNPDGMVHCVLLHSPRWRLVAGDIAHHDAIRAAIAKAEDDA